MDVRDRGDGEIGSGKRKDVGDVSMAGGEREIGKEIHLCGSGDGRIGSGTLKRV